MTSDMNPAEYSTNLPHDLFHQETPLTSPSPWSTPALARGGSLNITSRRASAGALKCFKTGFHQQPLKQFWLKLHARLRGCEIPSPPPTLPWLYYGCPNHSSSRNPTAAQLPNFYPVLRRHFRTGKEKLGGFSKAIGPTAFDPVQPLFSGPMTQCWYESLDTKHIYCFSHIVLAISHTAEEMHFQICQLSLLNIKLPKIIVYTWCSLPKDFLLFNYIKRLLTAADDAALSKWSQCYQK